MPNKKTKIKMPMSLMGYCTDSPFMEMDYKTFCEWVTGEMVIAIGAGNFKQQVSSYIQMAMARGAKRQIELLNEQT